MISNFIIMDVMKQINKLTIYAGIQIKPYQ